LKEKRRVQGKIAVGENNRNNPWNTMLSIHAEIDALNKLMSKKNNLKRTSYDLIVIRLSKTGKLGESRPCYHCLQKLENSGLKIKNVYYSTRGGNLEKERFKYMKESHKTTYSSGYRRSMRRHNEIKKFVYS